MSLKPLRKKLFRFLNSPVLWVILAMLPALVIYGNRFLIPDTSTDSVSYHVFNGERGLLHPLTPFTGKEFYPTGIANIPPGLDIMNYVARSALGYRLGTILSLLSAMGIVFVLYKLLRLLLHETKHGFNAGWGLLLVNAAIVLEVYFQLATYFVDILNALFVMLLFYWTLRLLTQKPRNLLISTRQWCLVLLAAGVLLAFKLTNFALVAPIVGLLLYNAYEHRESLARRTLLIRLALLVLFIVPILPLFLQNIRMSGNPTLPYYNGIFHSVYYPPVNYADTNFGGTTPVQKLFWPVASLVRQNRLGEPHQIYNDYKLIIYWGIGVLLCLLALVKLIRLGRVEKIVLYYFLTSLFLWGLLFGINRYAVSSISIGGLVVAVLALAALENPKRYVRSLLAIIVLGLVAALSIESYRVINFNLTYDMSWRPTLIKNQELHRQQMDHLFDRELALSDAEKKLVASSTVLLNCHTNVAGLLSLLPGSFSKPTLNIISDKLPQYAAMSGRDTYRTKVRQRLDLPAKTTVVTWVSIIADKDVGPTSESCLANIAARGGTVTYNQPLPSMLGDSAIHLDFIAGTMPL